MLCVLGPGDIMIIQTALAPKEFAVKWDSQVRKQVFTVQNRKE